MRGSITVKNLSKDFKLPHEKSSTLKGAALNLLKLRRNRTVETQRVLDNISLSIKPGEFFGVLGRNGSGKSTLLKILAGIYQPTAGDLQVEGKSVPFIELGVGFNGELSGRDNVYLNGSLLGFSKSEMDKMYKDIVEFAELENFMDQKLKNYSSGMQVRLAFSIAVRARTDILLVDEVLAVGDASFQRKCFEYFKKLKADKKTVVFVTHDMDAVREYCDRAILIEGTKLRYEGSPDRVASEYNRLFTSVSADQEPSHKRTTRYGNQKAQIERVNAPKVIRAKDSDLVIEARVKFNQDTENPILGFVVKNSAGLAVCGTNNQVMGNKLGIKKKDEQINLTWRVPNIFNDGKHTIDVAILGNKGLEQYDWWESAAVFTVDREDKTPYPANPKVKMEIG